MLFSKVPRPKQEGHQSNAASGHRVVSWKLWNNRSQQPLGSGSKDHPKGSKPPQRRWFSTFRLKQLHEGGIQSGAPTGAGPSLSKIEPEDSAGKIFLRQPIAVNHRKSISSVFKTVRTRYSRDRLDKNEVDRTSPPPLQVVGAGLIEQEVPGIRAHPRKASPPPRLEMPSDLAARDTSTGPSTFRANLEKAVADINNKYGSSSCTEPYTALEQNLQQTLRQAGDRSYTVPRPLPYFPLGNFRPRYQLPTFMDPPASKAKSTIGELRELSSTLSDESVSLEMIEDVDNKDPEGGGCHPPTLLLNEVAGSSFDLDKFMAAKAAPFGEQKPVKQVVSTGKDESSGIESTTSSSSENSTDPVIQEVTVETDTQSSQSPKNIPPQPTAVPTTVASSTESKACDVDCLSTTQNLPEKTHHRQRSNSEQAPYRTRGSHESLIIEARLEVKRARAKSTTDDSECSSVIRNTQHSAQKNDGPASPDENVPSVSDLVRKFRRMGSLPGAFPPNPSLDLPKQNPAIRRVSRGHQFETFRNRFSSDSDACSLLSSSPGTTSEDLNQLQVPPPAYEVQEAFQS